MRNKHEEFSDDRGKMQMYRKIKTRIWAAKDILNIRTKTHTNREKTHYTLYTMYTIAKISQKD